MIQGASSRTDWVCLLAVLAIIIAATVVRLPGVHWLAGYGFQPDYSFHPDDDRFIVAARDFQNPDSKPGGYPLFMPTQLFVVDAVLHKLHRTANGAVALRAISMVYAGLSILLAYYFLVALGFSRPVSLLSCFFLAFSPLHVILSHFGTADMSAFFLFYLTIFAAWRYRATSGEHRTSPGRECRISDGARGASSGEFWYYTAIAAAGVTMADKFFLPSLVPVALIVLYRPLAGAGSRIFVATSVFLAFFCVASFFNFTPWDLSALLRMLAFDNMVLSGGRGPLTQLMLYPWDLVACSGLLTTVLAVLGGFYLLHRGGVSRLGGLLGGLRQDMTSWPRVAARGSQWLRSPQAVIVLPLLFHALLIVAAQVHFSRHILIFVPIVCVLAAIAVAGALRALRSTALVIRALAVVVAAALLAVQLVDAAVTDRIYPTDVRAQLAAFVAARQPALPASTFSRYTHLQDVALIEEGIPDTPLFVTCDLEYARYKRFAPLPGGKKRKAPLHVYGGAERTEFFHALFDGDTRYVPVFDAKRERRSLEDRLAESGWLPDLDTYVPEECRAFQQGNP